MAKFEIGSLVRFTYPAVHRQQTKAHDRYPKVLVLHGGWRNPQLMPNTNKLFLHGLNTNYLTNAEFNLLRMVIDVKFQLKYYKALQKENPRIAQEFDRIIAGAEKANITSPHDFYLRVIKPFIKPRGYDPYRLYDLDKITGVKVIQPRRKMVGEQKTFFDKFADKFQFARGPQGMRFQPGMGFRKDPQRVLPQPGEYLPSKKE